MQPNDLLLSRCPKLTYLNENSLNAFCILVLLLLLLVALLSMQNMMISICSHLLQLMWKILWMFRNVSLNGRDRKFPRDY